MLVFFVNHTVTYPEVFLGRLLQTSVPCRRHYGWCQVENFSKFVPLSEKVKLENCFLNARVWVPKQVYQSTKQPECVLVMYVKVDNRKAAWKRKVSLKIILCYVTSSSLFLF